MPPVRTPGGRASKACEGCRRGKTRCYPTAQGPCLRCNTLRLKCSLQDEPPDPILPDQLLHPHNTHSPHAVRHDCLAVEERVGVLERTVQRLTEAVGLDLDHEPALGAWTDFKDDLQKAASSEAAPLQIIKDAATEVEHYQPDQRYYDSENIITKGYLTADEVRFLLRVFRNHYRRWIALREQENAGPELDIESSPLLMCACCLIAARHWSSDRALQTVDLLFNEAKSLLSLQLLQAPQPLAFFQAVLILSLWATTVGQRLMSMDSWLLTGYAIQHSSASDVFKDTNFSSSLDSEYGSTIGKLLLFNRICMAHLHACVSMRRTASITKSHLDRMRKRLPPNELSNYEIRMVAETALYWTLYENAIASPVNLLQAQAALRGWKHIYGFLFDQPRPMFIQMGFHFAQLLIYEQSLNNKSAAVRESLLSEMIRLCSAILQIAMDTADDRTKHLTDHIYHLITFAAVTMCRLLCKYEAQLQARFNIADCDMQILNTAQWLHTLGSIMHVGHTMGNVINAVHRKLRPTIHAALRRESEPEYPTPDQHTFPDLLGMPMGMDTLPFDWDTAIPDWQSFGSGDDFIPPPVAPVMNPPR